MCGHSEYPVYVPDGLTKEYLMKIQKRAYIEFYFRPRYIMKRLREVRDIQQFNKYLKNAAGYVKNSIL